MVDHNKVKRAQEKNMKFLDLEFDNLCKKGEVFLDGRVDTTKLTLKADSSVQQYSNIMNEQHYFVCIEKVGGISITLLQIKI